MLKLHDVSFRLHLSFADNNFIFVYFCSYAFVLFTSFSLGLDYDHPDDDSFQPTAGRDYAELAAPARQSDFGVVGGATDSVIVQVAPCGLRRRLVG